MKSIQTGIISFLLILSIPVFTQCNQINNHNDNLSGNSKENPIETAETIPDSIVQFLLNSAAGDFIKNKTSNAIDFHNVKIKYVQAPDGNKLYVMCGEFIEAQKNKIEWIPFATIITLDYEQWIGSGALTYCRDFKVISENETDLSNELKDRINYSGK